MNNFDLVLPPLVKGRVQGYLEIEVCRINFIQFDAVVTSTVTNQKKTNKKRNCRKNRNHIKQNTKRRRRDIKTPKGLRCCAQEAIVKFIWWGENFESAAAVATSVSTGGIVHQQQCCRCRDQQQRQQHKLRYSVRTSLALFLDYLHSCEPIEIVVVVLTDAGSSGSDLTSLAVAKPLGSANIRLPGALLRKYATNYSSGCPFEYTTEIYAIYGNGRPEGVHQPSSQLQTQQQLKTGEIQLRFRMLFAACATKHTPTLGQQQLTTLQQLSELKEPTSLMNVPSSTTSPQQLQHNQMPTAGNTATAAMIGNEEAKEAMRKLDAKLVAYLAGENMLPKQSEPELELKADEEELNLEDMQDTTSDETVKMAIREEKLQLFKRINGIKLQLEALTLEAEGTKRMELLQNEIRPIFTVECQLSHELIKHVPRYEMFHIMQFESEKFHSLTQCTRFGQEAQREVNLSQVDAAIDTVAAAAATAGYAGDIVNFGRIHFVVWWREPGTCLNEMLGMGVLELKDLYNASLLEQCKRITINRRGVQLANIYLKINLQLPTNQNHNPNYNQNQNNNMNNNSNNNNNIITMNCHVQQQLNELLARSNISGNGSDNNNNKNNYNDINVDEESIIKQPNSNEIAGNNDKPLATATENTKSTVAAAAAAGANIDTTTAAAAVVAATNPVLPDNNNPGGSGGDNNFQLESSGNFTAETCKIRLLKGLIYANETRQFEMNANCEYFLVCRRFWHEEPAVLVASGDQQFNYQEQFGIINDEQFLKRVERQQLQLEIWHRVRTAAVANDNHRNGNGNANINSNKLLPVGIAQLPLHQFFIAYKDEAMTNRLCKGKLPVVSIDAWTPILSYHDRKQTHNSNLSTVGELKCMLAIGSEEQIRNLKIERGLPTQTGEITIATVADNSLFALNRLDVPSDTKMPALAANVASSSNSTIGSTTANADLRKTSDLLDMLQQALSTPPSATQLITAAASVSASVPVTTATTSAYTAAPTPLKPIQHKSFKFEMGILRANGLPVNPAAKGKTAKSAKRPANVLASKRFPPGEAPSTYVTFQADDCQGSKQHKSHEGGVYATGVIERSVQPQWQQYFRVTTSVDYLKNPQQRFILKLWKKAACVSSATSSHTVQNTRAQPTPMEDAIIGFAALELSAFTRGLGINGWFNVVDFNGRINGQLQLRAKPLEDVHKILNILSPQQATPSSSTVYSPSASVDAVIDQFENSLDLTHLNLGQAIKRKFTELEEISQRLRTRLTDITGANFAPEFNIAALDDWQPLENEADDELAEFEHDINTEVPSTSAAAVAQNVTQASTDGKNDPMISMKQKTAEGGVADE